MNERVIRSSLEQAEKKADGCDGLAQRGSMGAKKLSFTALAFAERGMRTERRFCTTQASSFSERGPGVVGSARRTSPVGATSSS